MISHIPPRNGGTVRLIAEGVVNPGRVSGNGKAVVYGEFESGVGESLHRWEDGQVEKVNHDGYSSFGARVNHDGNVVVYSRYSLQDALNPEGNWDVGRWKDGKIEVVAGTDLHELSPRVDASGDVVVYDVETPPGRAYTVRRWENGETEDITDGTAKDMFPVLSADGSRMAWRHDLSEVRLRDQNGASKAIPTLGEVPTSIVLDQKGDKILYSARVDGDRDLFLLDTRDSTVTSVATLKGVDENDASMSPDGKTIAYTAIDRRKETADVNVWVWVWREGKTEQLTWNDGSLNGFPSVSDDGNSIAWYSVDRQNPDYRRVLLWQKSEGANE